MRSTLNSIHQGRQLLLQAIALDPRFAEASTPRIHWMHGRMLLYVDRAHDAGLEMRQAMAASPNQYRVAASWANCSITRASSTKPDSF